MSCDNIRIRPMTEADLPLVINYWQSRTHEQLLKMGVDQQKLEEVNLPVFLQEQLALPLESKQSYWLIWLLVNEINNEETPIGHSNVGKLQVGKEAYMHLHLWDTHLRQKGLGQELVKASLKHYFQILQLEILYCEPNALNEAPNKTLQKVGFEFVKNYVTIPGFINFEQPINRYEMSRERFQSLYGEI